MQGGGRAAFATPSVAPSRIKFLYEYKKNKRSRSRNEIHTPFITIPIFLNLRSEMENTLENKKLNAMGTASIPKIILQFSVPAINALKAYSWPGNVRELENCIERAVLTARDETVHTYNLPESLQSEEFREDPFSGNSTLSLDEQIAAFERRVLDDALARHGGSHSEAARELGISPRMMCYRLARSGSAAYRGSLPRRMKPR